MASISLELKQHSRTAMILENDSFHTIVDRPIEKGGGGDGLMGGQHLLMGIGGCFCSTLFAAAEGRGVTIEGLLVKISAEISEDLPNRFISVKLFVSLSKKDPSVPLDKLIRIAEKGCLSINTIKQGLSFGAVIS